jgi:hypothetical protein
VSGDYRLTAGQRVEDSNATRVAGIDGFAYSITNNRAEERVRTWSDHVRGISEGCPRHCDHSNDHQDRDEQDTF